jgi:hypothetical protein
MSRTNIASRTTHLEVTDSAWFQARSAATNIGRPFKAGVLQQKAVRRVATFEAKRQINSPIEKIERRYATASFLIEVRGLKPHGYIRCLATRGKAFAFPNCIITAQGSYVGGAEACLKITRALFGERRVGCLGSVETLPSTRIWREALPRFRC